MGFALFVSPQYSLCTGSFIILAVVVVVIIIITSLLNYAGGVEKVRMWAIECKLLEAEFCQQVTLSQALPPWYVDYGLQSHVSAHIGEVIPLQRKRTDLCSGQEGPAQQLHLAQGVSGNRPFWQ